MGAGRGKGTYREAGVGMSFLGRVKDGGRLDAGALVGR